MSPLVAVALLLGTLVAGAVPVPAAAVPAPALGPPTTTSHSGAAPPGQSSGPTGLLSALVGASPATAPPSGAAPPGRGSRPAGLLPALVGASPATAPGAGWVYPVGPPGGPAEVVHGFDPPGQPWLAGHRGVDLAATAGAEVRAAGPGTVTYAAPLAGRGVVVIDHGSLRTTYEPVAATVGVGDPVTAGAPIGTLEAAASHCAPAACLHWGAREGERYTDPLALVGAGPVRLLPLGERTLSGGPPPPPRPPAPPSSSGGLAWPVAAPRVTSSYGMRVHPVTGERKLHDGVDLAAACGAPIRAAAPGRVGGVGDRGPYGLQVTVDHSRIRGAPLTTSYSHLSALSVTQGQQVRAGQVVGRAGTTGLSTGCHLHLMLYAGGRVTDPLPWFG